ELAPRTMAVSLWVSRIGIESSAGLFTRTLVGGPFNRLRASRNSSSSRTEVGRRFLASRRRWERVKRVLVVSLSKVIVGCAARFRLKTSQKRRYLESKRTTHPLPRWRGYWSRA